MQENADELIADVQRLVSCESPSHDLEAVGRSADAVAEIGIRLLGAAPERVVIDGCTHLRWRFGTAARVLVLGHHDTVWPLGSLRAHPAEVVDGRLRGPGSFDMKAGLVMALHAVAALPDRDGVTVLVTGDEEPGSPTSRVLIEQEARGCEAALILEAAGPGGALKTARKGVSRYEVHVHGRAAHAGLEPENGVNATIELSHQVQAVAALSDPVRGTTVTPTTANGGTTSNTVPARASFSVDVRAASVAEQHRTHDAITALRPRLT
ncbi:MAG TPA: M20/M25/M40 family metallo-hydrolase, partial [Microbacterium sp.]|nr:M20/M25/M40 family metallo-hydrolase [Microbacterium sp.]